MKRLKCSLLRAAHFRPLVAVLLAACASACITLRDANNTSSVNHNTTANQNASASSAGAADMAKLDAELSSLEKQSEKNPGDDDLHRQLSEAYMRRADALRDAQKLEEALRDYRNALRHDPDNADAQERAAEIGKQVEGEATGENGEPAPLPISPNVTTGDDEDADKADAVGNAANKQTPTPTPKKNERK